MANTVECKIEIVKGDAKAFFGWLLDGAEIRVGPREFTWNGQPPRVGHWKLNDLIPEHESSHWITMSISNSSGVPEC